MSIPRRRALIAIVAAASAVAPLASPGFTAPQTSDSSSAAEVPAVTATASAAAAAQGLDVHNLGVLQRTWLPARSRADNEAAVIGYVGDSVAEGEGLQPGPNALQQRIIERLQSKMRASSAIPFCYPNPSIYKQSSTLIPGWYQSTPQLSSVELPKNRPVNTGWARNSYTGPGGRTANLTLPSTSSGGAAARGTSVTMSGTFSAFDLDYYASSWGRNMEVRLDGSVLTTLSTFEQLGAWQYSPRKFSWRDPNGATKQHTLVITATRDPRFNGGSVAVGGITPYDSDRTRCEKVLDLSHGGFGYNFALEIAPQTIRDNVRSGSRSRGLDIMILAYGYNDPAYYTPSQFSAAVQRYIDKTRSHGYGGPILLVGMPTPAISSGWKVRDWDPYLDALKSRATWANNAAYVGLNNVISAQPNGGVWADTVHLNATGTNLVAEYLSSVLTASKYRGNNYTALGDSFSAGTGTFARNPGDPCYRSVYGYAPQLALAQQLTLTYSACHGHTTANLNANQLIDLTDATDYVTVTIGGNDVGFTPVMEECVTSVTADDCRRAIEDRQDELDSMPAKLASTFRQIRQHAPQAKISVAGYPHLVATPTCIGVLNLNNDNAELINVKVDELNNHIRRATAAFDMRYIDPTAHFFGHEACGGAGEWINGISDPREESFHPNREGNLAYMRLFTESLAYPYPSLKSDAQKEVSPDAPARTAEEATASEIYAAAMTYRPLVTDSDSPYMRKMVSEGWGRQDVTDFRSDILSDDPDRWRAAIDWWLAARDRHDG